MPTVTISPANQDAWIADILSGLLILILAIPILIMASRFRDMSYNEYFEIILGKPIGKAVNLLYTLYLLIIVLLSVILLSDFLLSTVYPETPMYAIVIFMLVPCMYASYKGIECIGRASVIFGIFIFFVILIYFVLSINNMDFKTFLPVIRDSSLTQLAFGTFNNATRFCDCFVFFMFIPYVKKNQNYSPTKILVMLVIAFTFFNTLIVIATQAVLGIGLASSLRYPYFISIQQINLFDIIQRIEFFNVIGWIIIFFFKISSTILTIAILIKQVFNTKSYKPFIIPLNIVIAMTVLLTSVSYFAVSKKIFTDYAYIGIFTMNFVVPSIILVVYLLRLKSLKKSGL